MTPLSTPAAQGTVDTRAFWETQRDIPHEEADAAAVRLINSHFKNDAERARVSIPANPDRDDDLLIRSYIRQQMRKAASPSPEALPASGVEVAREALGSPDGWREQREALQVWTRSGFLAGEKVANEAWHKHELYSDLNRIVQWLHSAEEAAAALTAAPAPEDR